MTSGQRNDSEFVFPDRVFGQVKEHRRSLGTWGDFPPASANLFDTPAARRSSFGSLGGIMPTGTFGYAPPSYGTYYEDFGGYPNTSSKMNSQSMQPIRYPSPNSFGYQRSFMNAYFKPASAAADDGVYRSTPPPPALVDDRIRVTPTSGGYFDSDIPMGEVGGRYGSGSNMNRSTPPSPMPYASFGQPNTSVMSTTGSSSGFSTPTGEIESMMGDNASTASAPIRPIAMPSVVTRENPTNTKLPQQQAASVTMREAAATTQPLKMASEEVTVLPPTIVQDNVAPPVMTPVAPMMAPIVMPSPPSVVTPAIAPIVNTPTVAVSVSEPVLLATPVPEMVFIPPPPPGAAAAIGPRTVLDIQPRETKPPTVVREMGPALPPVLGVDVGAASSSAMMTPPYANSRASTPTPSPKNSMGRTSTPSPIGAQIPVATPPEYMWNMTQVGGAGSRGTPSPTPSNAMAQVPVATPPGMMGPMGPPPNTLPVGPTDAIVTDDDSEKKAHGIHRLTQKMHRHKK